MLPQHDAHYKPKTMYNMGPNVCLGIIHPSFFFELKQHGLGQGQTRKKKKVMILGQVYIHT